jgi:hypothetical protein
MITRLIKNRFAVSLIYLLVFSLLLTSCETVTFQKIKPESLTGSNVKIEDITHIVLTNGTFIPTEGKDVYYSDKYKDLTKVLIVRDRTGIPVRDTVRNINVIKLSEITYPVTDVKELYLEKRETDTKRSITAGITIVLGAMLLALIISVAVFLADLNHSHSCPFIYSYDGAKYILDAEPLGGAICEGLERTDVSILELMKIIDGKFQFKVRNNNDEQQRVDAMKFISINHSKDETITPDFSKKFYKYKNAVKPVSVINEEGKDLTKFFESKDDVRWYNDLPVDTVSKPFESKEKLTLRFPRPKNANNAMLLINGGASVFGSNMVPKFLELKGNQVDDWYKSVYPGSDEQKNLFNIMHRDETYYMDIKISDDGVLRNTGIMKSNGPMVDEDVLYPVKLDNSNSDFIEIVLTPQRYFWKFDMINIIYDYDEVNTSDVEQLNITSAKDNNGKDVKEKLSATDKDYYRMPNIGDYTDLYVNAPKNYTRETNSIFVETTGWYDINLAKDKKPDDKQLENIFTAEGGLLKYALELYYKNLKDVTQAYNIKFGIR